MGIVESEGCFSCGVIKTSGNPQFIPRFSITQTDSYDELNQLKEYLFSVGIEAKISKDGIALYISSPKETDKIRDFFHNQKFFFKKKQRSFLIWSRLIDAVRLCKHKTPEQVENIWNLRQQINPSKKGSSGRQLKDYLN